ncbi:MAG TPA: hypothetical protein VK624_14790 [Steroidobacteraceae bacterium]|nr:hypothetical protein [Steroidobacteraceae bacterium]
MGIDNNIDWTIPTTPQTEQYGPGLARESAFLSKKDAAVAVSKRSVMDTLLGENSLAAFDAGGNDPYNATGRQFRR